MSRRRLPALVAALVSLVGALAVPALAGSPVTTPAFTDADGIHVVSPQRIDDRQYDVTVSTAALGRTVDVRILVPADYGTRPTARYPVLYLFHGTSGRASDWVNSGNAEQATAGLPLIVVMPDAGFDGDGGGWCTNWYDAKTAKGPAQWETFHVTQLVPWIDANLDTVADRDGRAIAGLSQGGFCASSYAARHPDTFLSFGSFSGAPDIDYDPLVAIGANAVISATAVGLDGVEPDAMFGPRATNEINWQGHDPADLAENLRWTDMWLFTATGAPGPLDPVPPSPAAMGIEAATHGSTMSFWERLQTLGITSHLDDYVLGTHSFPYWARDLEQYLPPLMHLFAHPPADPRTVSYQSIDKHWTQWGWDVDLHRPSAQQWSGLSGADARGFTLSGVGTATVVTPAFYRPNSPATATLSTGATQHLIADQGGHLHLTVPLGATADPGSAAVVGVPVPPDTPPMGTVTVTISGTPAPAPGG